MSKIPGTSANKEAKMEQGTGSGYGTGSSHTGSGDFVLSHMLMCIGSIRTSFNVWHCAAALSACFSAQCFVSVLSLLTLWHQLSLV